MVRGSAGPRGFVGRPGHLDEDLPGSDRDPRDRSRRRSIVGRAVPWAEVSAFGRDYRCRGLGADWGIRYGGIAPFPWSARARARQPPRWARDALGDPHRQTHRAGVQLRIAQPRGGRCPSCRRVDDPTAGLRRAPRSRDYLAAEDGLDARLGRSRARLLDHEQGWVATVSHLVAAILAGARGPHGAAGAGAFHRLLPRHAGQLVREPVLRLSRSACCPRLRPQEPAPRRAVRPPAFRPRPPTRAGPQRKCDYLLILLREGSAAQSLRNTRQPGRVATAIKRRPNENGGLV